MINIRRPSTDHRPGRACRCAGRCNHSEYTFTICQICNGHYCVNPDCDSSIGYAGEEHFGLRCDTCPYERETGGRGVFRFLIRFQGCQSFFEKTWEQHGHYKDDDPEVLRGSYDAGEKRIVRLEKIYNFCMSAPEALQLQGQRIWGRTNHHRAYEPPTVKWEYGHVYRTWEVCEDCQVPVYKSIRRYKERLEKESQRREKEYYYQLDALNEGKKILTAVKHLLKEKKKGAAV